MRERLILVTSAVWCGAIAHAYVPVMLHPDGAGFGTRAISASQGQQVGYMQNEIGAFLWSGSAASMIDLSPPGYTFATVSALFNGRQIGGAYQPGLDQGHALMWNSSPSDFVNLHVTSLGGQAIQDTFGYGIGGNQQVGVGINFEGGIRAVLWSGSPETAVMLHPGGPWWHTEALATDGVQQVGRGDGGSLGIRRALLWSGTAESMIDLTPTGADEAIAFGVANGQQVGRADFGPGIRNNAILWFGTASNYVNLNPSAGFISALSATNGIQQVGGYAPASLDWAHAAVWSGTAASMHNLHQYLPPEWGAVISGALGIDEAGNIVGYIRDSQGFDRAVMWVVPEPGTMAALAAGIGLLVLRRRRKCASG